MKLWLKNTFCFWPGLLEMITIYHGSHLQPRRDKALFSLVYSLFEKWFWRVYLRFQRLCNTDGKIFHPHWKIVAYWMVLLFVWLAKDDGNFHPRIFSHRLKMTVEFSTFILVVIYSRDGIKPYSLLFTACLKNDFGESIYVFSVCVTLTAKFSIPIERLSRTEWSCFLYD